MQLSHLAQEGLLAHQGQVRARQVRVRQASDTATVLPVFVNNLSMSGENGRIPLRLRDAPPAPSPSALQKFAPGNQRAINGFIRGDLQTSADSGGTGLSTTDLTFGGDYRAADGLLFGAAAGGLRTAQATGSIVSAYLTLQPVGRLFLDMSLSLSAHHSRSGGDPAADDQADGPGVSGVSRAFSMTLNHPRRIGQWHWLPYSRYDRITTEVDARGSPSSAPAVTYGLSAVSLGSTAATTWATRFGRLQPSLLVELQHEVLTVAGGGTTSTHTQGTVGLAMTATVSRDLSAFAESRYESDLVATLDRQMMLGVRLRF